MTLLRRHHRDHRARAPKRRKRRNLCKFIPQADSDFAFTALNFAGYLKRDPAAHGITVEDAQSIDQAVVKFRAALARSLSKRTRNMDTTAAKDAARKQAEAIIRRFANIIRANPNVSSTHKKLLRIKERPKTLKPRTCPKRRPKLMFMGTGDGESITGGVGGGSGVHVLRFFDAVASLRDDGILRRARPDGAARLELFVDLVPPGEPVPRHPSERSGRPWYLRSFTRSPIEVEYPVPMSGPMLVVYWARWADATGGVGRFSKTCVARVEGWTADAAPGMAPAPGMALPEGTALVKGTAVRRVETKYVVVQVPYVLPEGLDGDDEAEAAEALLLPAGHDQAMER